MSTGWPSPQVRSTVLSRGLRLAVSEWGDVATARLVLVGAHGFLDCAEFFAPLVASLQARRSGLAFVAFSFAGHGRSSWADAYGWYDHTVDLLAVGWAAARRAATAQQFGLVGHSFGAVQMLQALSLEPSLADFAVNLDAVSGPFSLSGVHLHTALAHAVERGGDVRPLPTYAGLGEIVARRAASNPRLSTALLRWLAPHLARREDGRYRWRVDPALAGWIRPWDLLGWAPPDPLQLTSTLPHAVLTVTGAAPDHPQVRGQYPGDAPIESLDTVTHLRLPGAGHYVHLECPDAVADAVLAHADAVARGRL